MWSWCFLWELTGGNIDVVGSKYEDNYGLMVSGSDEPSLMGRKVHINAI